jgi:hypothetical protein
MTLPSKERWYEMPPYERHRRYKQLSLREKGKVIQWQVNDDFDEATADRRFDQRCDRIEERRKAIQERKRKRREVQKLLIEIIGERKHWPKEMAKLSGLSKTYILSLSRENFTKDEHREFLAMDEGIPPKGPRTPQRIDLRTPEERWLDEYEAWVERRLEACRTIWATTKI